MISRPNAHAISEGWGLSAALLAHPGLNLIPDGGDNVVVAGELRFAKKGPDESLIEDAYAIELRIPRIYPMRGLPQVFETANRIPRDFHHLDDGSLCLGAPTRLRLLALRTPDIGHFINEAVIPYLYSRSYFERFGSMPFGELDHGTPGLEQDLVAMLGMPRGTKADCLLRVASMRRRHANKRQCPCGSGRRLGKCHNHAVNAARAQLGRRWFAGQSLQFYGRAIASGRRHCR